MEIQDIQVAIEKALAEAVNALRDKGRNPDVRVLFPSYTRGKRLPRISEQELRFAFVERILPFLRENGLYYSVETPTNDVYRFSRDRHQCEPLAGEGQSANFDLTITDGNPGKLLAIIEFKAKTASEHEYAKDFCKLLNPNEIAYLYYFINLFESYNQMSSFASRVTSANSQMKNVSFERREILNVYACSLNKSENSLQEIK